MFKPLAFKNSNIAGADSAGLAVKTNMSLLPNLPWSFSALLKRGATFPSTTLLNSEKSNSYPKPNKSWYVLAYCSGVKVPFVPSGVVYLIKDLLVAKVSSKSKTVIPLAFLITLRPSTTTFWETFISLIFLLSFMLEVSWPYTLPLSFGSILSIAYKSGWPKVFML